MELWSLAHPQPKHLQGKLAESLTKELAAKFPIHSYEPADACVLASAVDPRFCSLSFLYEKDRAHDHNVILSKAEIRMPRVSKAWMPEPEEGLLAKVRKVNSGILSQLLRKEVDSSKCPSKDQAEAFQQKLRKDVEV